ncbi:MAG: Nif3-like dinuclear metal center hexameric protein [Mycoplasmatales bacterium]
MKLIKLINTLETFYPIDLAEDWDNVGLLLGDERKEVTRVLTTLEINEDVIDEAIERGAELIISHHPLIFKPLKNLNYKNIQAGLIQNLIKNDIAVYCMHTNVDVATNGMNDWLAQILELENLNVLVPTVERKFKKILVEITEEEMYKVIDIFKKTGVGQRFNFMENINITPKVKYATKHDNSEVEINILVLESFVLEDQIKELKNEFYVNKIFNYEIMEIENMSVHFGLGRVGHLKPTSLEQLAIKLKDLYSLDHVKIVGNRETIIRKVAIVGGAGSDTLEMAKIKGCDVLITGDVGFHTAQEALARNIAIIDPGHNIEIIFNDTMADFINMFPSIIAFPSEIDTNPFEVILWASH